MNNVGGNESLTSKAYNYLFDKIVRCVLAPGAEINEKQLLEDSGIGRTPLREALVKLQEDGLISIFPRKGMMVTELTEKTIHDLYQTRKYIEPGMICECKALYSKVVLMDFLRRFEESVTMDHLERFDLDLEFHMYLISITNNDVLIKTYSSLMITQKRLAMYAIVQEEGAEQEFIFEQHRKIIDALLRENDSDIRDAVVFHLSHSMIRSLNSIKGISLAEK